MEFSNNIYGNDWMRFGLYPDETEDRDYVKLCSFYFDLADSRRQDNLERMNALRDDIRAFKQDPSRDMVEWIGQSYAAEYGRNEVLVYFLYDETYRATYPSALFDTVLDQAIAFVEAGSDDETELRTAPVVL